MAECTLQFFSSGLLQHFSKVVNLLRAIFHHNLAELPFNSTKNKETLAT